MRDGTVGALARTTDGNPSRTYTRASSTNGSTTDVVDESGNTSTITFTNESGTFYETHRKVYEGAGGGTPIFEQQTCYTAAMKCDGQLFSLPIDRLWRDTYLNGVGVLHDVTNFSPGSGQISQELKYDLSTNMPLLTTENYQYTSLGHLASDILLDGSGNQISKITYGYDESTPTTTSGIPQHNQGTSSGNQTSTHAWINTSNSTLDTSTTYYDTGMPVSTSGPTNGSTTYTYDSTQGFATQITPPVPLPSYASYDVASGLQLSTSDANFPASAQIQYSQYDALLRPTLIQSADGGKTQISYPDPNHTSTWVYQATATHSDDEFELDSYGRLSRRALYNGQSTNGWYQVDYCYDVTGQLQFQSAPYQDQGFAATKHCAGAGTSYQYDALGRPLTVVSPDGTVSYTYNGRTVKVQDQNGITRITQYDALGRISVICEVSSNPLLGDSPKDCGTDITGYTGYLTSYAYDQANHTTTISSTNNQGVQQRAFQTDSLGRLIKTTEPESGETTYSYDYVWVNPNTSSMQITRKRPRANQSDPNVKTSTSTQFDQIGRVTAVYYDDGVTSNKSYIYDEPTHWGTVSLGASKGHLTYAEGYGKATQFAYDSMGRITNTIQCLPGFCGNPYLDVWRFYSYDLASEQTQESYMTQGAGGTRKDTDYTYNQAGQLTSVTDNTSGNIIYNTVLGTFGLSTWSFGNGLTGYRDYDWAGRIFNIRVCATTPGVNCSPGRYGVNAYRSNGRQYASDDSVIAATTYYGYDDFNRQTSTNMNFWNGGVKNFTYVYDRYGNKWQQNAPQGGPAPQFTFDKTTNRIADAGFTYDAAGNMTSDGNHTYTYDAEGNLLQVDGGSTASYTYDALNHRVQTVVHGVTTNFAYNVNGQRVASYDASGNAISNQVYAGATPIAFYQGGQIHYQHQDWLGTERVRTDANGNIESTYSSLPFGDNFSASGTDADQYHYAALDRDSETDTQHAQFRQYSSTEGRWLSPDPYRGSYDFTDPQTWNRYVYVRNNPLSFLDPTGLDHCEGYNTTTNSGAYLDPNFPYNCSLLGGHWVADPPPQNASGQPCSSGDPSCNVTVTTTAPVDWFAGWSLGALGGVGPGGAGTGNGYGNAGDGIAAGQAGAGTAPNNNGCWYDPTSHAVGGASVGATAVQFGSGARTIGSNLKLYSSGWRGNQYVTTVRLSKAADLGGRVLAAGGVVVDAYAYSQGTISGGKFALNTAVTAVGVWGGPVGAGVAVVYFGVDYFYPDLFQNLLNKVGSQSPQNTCSVHQ